MPSRETRALLSVGFILALCLVLWALEGLGLIAR